MRSFIITALVAGLTFGATAAQAGNPEATATRVSYAGLDLGKASDRAVLERRLAASLETVCGSYINARPEEEREIALCRADAKAQTDAAVAMLLRQQAVQLAAR